MQDNTVNPRRRRTAPTGRRSATTPTVGGVLPTVPSQRGTLTRQKVLTAAIEVIDTDGAREFTMRAVAERFGVETMALYRYFTSREDLLDGVVERVVDDLYSDPRVQTNTDNWREFLTGVAYRVRSTALAHPLLFPLIATRGSASPWVWPPLRSLRWMEGFLETFHRCGFGGAASLRAYRGFSSFLLGHLLLETFPHPAATPTHRSPPELVISPTLVGHPRLRGLQSELSIDHTAEEFGSSLHHLIDRINSLERRPPPDTPHQAT